MNLTVLRPYAFYALLVFIPVIVFLILRYNRLIKSFGMNNQIEKRDSAFRRLKKCFILRTIFRILAGVMLVFAYAGISWGTNLVPVKKSGNALAMVFDVSYSMRAKDSLNSASRLEYASLYAQKLMENLEDTSISVVLTKGEGFVAVPLTQDYTAVYSLMEQLSPELMTSTGTDLGSGIEAAINAFPPQSSQAACIWLFTDGDETKGNLSGALSEAKKKGIPVTIIGFGSKPGAQIIAGDGTTVVNTSLRSDQLENMVSSINRKFEGTNAPLMYIDSSEVGSATAILNSMNIRRRREGDHYSESDRNLISYEIQTVQRNNIFLMAALVSIALSFIFGELNFSRGRKKINLRSSSSVLLLIMLLGGCSSRFNDGYSILEGKVFWNRKNYQEAVVYFLQAEDSALTRQDEEYQQYAAYNLGSTYLMQNETEAAMNRFDKIDKNVSEKIKFSVLYNSGIIAHRNGDYEKAVQCFKQALQIDSRNTNAKINLELSLQQKKVQVQGAQSQENPVSAENNNEALEEAIYSIIRENDQNRWKNQQQESESNSKDY